MRWLVIWLAVACHPARTAPLPPTTTLDRIAPLALPQPPRAQHDCRPSSHVRSWFSHAARSGVRPCGTLDLTATADARAAARHCLAESFRRGEAFLVEQQVPASDGVIAHAVFGAVEDRHGALNVYRADYEVPSCIGACSIIRNLRVSRCRGAALVPCSNDLSTCIRCESEDELASCSVFDDRPLGADFFDHGAHVPQLGEEEVARDLLEVADAGRAASAALVADDSRDDLDVTVAP